MTALLAKRAKSKSQELELEFQPDLTVGTVIAREGFSGTDAEAITAVINGTQATHDQGIADGDTVELLVGIAGG